MPKQEIQLKAQSEKQKLIWRKKFHKMLKAIPRFFGNMLTPKEKLTLVYQELKFKSEEGEERKTTTDKEKAEVWLVSSVAYSQLNQREIYH